MRGGARARKDETRRNLSPRGARGEAQGAPFNRQLADAERAHAVVRCVRRAYPPGSSQYIEIGHWGGLVAFARGRVEEAVTAFSENVEATRRLWPRIDHPRIALSDCALGAALVRAGRGPEGRPLLARCDVAARWGLVDRGVLRWGREAAR